MPRNYTTCLIPFVSDNGRKSMGGYVAFCEGKLNQDMDFLCLLLGINDAEREIPRRNLVWPGKDLRGALADADKAQLVINWEPLPAKQVMAG